MSADRIPTVWAPILRLPEFVDLQHRRRRVTGWLGAAAIAMFAIFLVGFAYFPDFLGEHAVVGIPLSLWLVFSQFAGTWVLVAVYFRLSRTYLDPAVRAVVAAIAEHTADEPTEKSMR